MINEMLGQTVVVDMRSPYVCIGTFTRADEKFIEMKNADLHDFRDTDAGSMLRVKGSDTLCPLGPGLVDDWDFHGKAIETRVNGTPAQAGNTAEMIWDMHYLIADLARTITLEPGDVILSGTPAHSRPVEPGDVVEVEVEGLGILRNTIVDGDVPVRDDVGAQPSASEEVVSTALGGDWEFRGIRAPRRD